MFASTFFTGSFLRGLDAPRPRGSFSGFIRALVVLVVALATPCAAQTTIPLSQARTPLLPSVPGDGVFIELFNNIGGGQPPVPQLLDGLVPTGTTLSPFVDFPRPGDRVNVGSSFIGFFASTTVPPQQVRALNASNFTLRIPGLIAIRPEFDTDPSTPGIQMTMSVNSDDGFHLVIGQTFIGLAGDRPPSWTDMPVTFEGPGLYPYTLHYCANAVGISGLEFAWIHAGTSGQREIIPQASLYRDTNRCVTQFTFDDLANGATTFATYAQQGLVLQTRQASVSVTNTRPQQWVPVTPPHVLGISGGAHEVVVMTFQTDSGQPAIVDYAELYVVNAVAATGGVIVDATDSNGQLVFSETVTTDGGAQRRVIIDRRDIQQVRVYVPAGTDQAAIDSVCIGNRSVNAFVPRLIDWAVFTGSTVDNGTRTVTGMMSGDPVTIRFPESIVAGVELDNAPINYFAGFNATHQGQTIANIPVGNSLVRFSGATSDDYGSFPGSIELNGNGTTLVMSVISLGGGSTVVPYVFDSSFAITSSGPGYWSSQPNPLWRRVPEPPGGGGGGGGERGDGDRGDSGGPPPEYALLGVEGHGSIQFDSGTSNVNFRVAGSESWNGFLIGVQRSADLVPVNVQFPPTVRGGLQSTLTFDIRNQAPVGADVAAGTHTVSVWFSDDQVPGNAGDRLLASINDTLILNPGQSRSFSITLNVPQINTSGFLIVQVNDGYTIYERAAARDNNTSAQPLVIGTPDLQMTEVTGPSTATFGSTVTVQSQIAFTGLAGAPTTWIDRLFLSTDAVASADDVPLAEATFDRGDLASGSYQRTFTATLPERFVGGNFFFIVRTDAGSSIVEVLESNNVAASGVVSIAATPTPDLAISNLAGPPGFTFGQPVILSYTASNAGSAAAAASLDRVYINSQNTFQGAQRLAEGARETLGAGQSQQRTITVTPPVNFTASGTYYLFVSLDDQVQTTDQSRTNNLASISLTAQPTPSVDLAAVSVAGPASAGDGSPATITWSVRNSGTLGANPPWVDRIYLSQTPTLNPATARVLGDFARNLSLTPGQAYSRTESVNIPAGLSGPWFLILQTNQLGTVSEPANTASNSVTSASPIEILQGQLPDFAVQTLSLGSERYITRPLDITYVARNAGTGTANGAWRDQIWFGPDGNAADPNSTDGLTLISDPLQFTVIGPGTIFGNSARINLPATPGRYRAVVVLDASAEINESNDTNNRQHQIIDVIAPEYNAVASVAVSESLMGQAIAITGSATQVNSGQPASNVRVLVQVVVRGVRRTIEVLTNTQGQFATSFFPLPTEAGAYSVFATHPAVDNAPVQDTFIIHGMVNLTPTPDLRVTPGDSQSTSFVIRNQGDLPLTGLTASVINAGEGVEVLVTAPAVLDAQQQATVNVNIITSGAASGPRFPEIVINSQQGATTRGTVNLTVAPPAAQLTPSRSSINESMVRGRITPVTLTVTNTGGQPTGPINVGVSSAAWLSLVTPTNLPSVLPGQSVDVNLSLAPPTSLPLGPYSGELVLAMAGQTLRVPFTFTNTSTLVGGLRVRVEDEFTYFAPGTPNVAGATVTLSNAFDNSPLPVTPGVTNQDGEAVFAGLTEGPVRVTVSSPNHGGAQVTAIVSANLETEAVIFLPRQLVTYSWNVVPTSIEDAYDITINATFETNVPAPVVTIEPAYVDLRDLNSGSRQVNFTIRNSGLIAAREVRLEYEGNSQYSFSPLLDEIGEIPANSQVVVPVTITRLAGRGSAPCVGVRFETKHTVICQVPRTYSVPVFFGINNPGCGGGGPFQVTGGGGGGGGSIAPLGGPSTVSNVECDPCKLKCALAVIGCIPGPHGCALGLANNCGALVEPPNWTKCSWEAFKCLVELTPVGKVLDCAYSLMCDCKCLFGFGNWSICLDNRGADPWARFNLFNPTEAGTPQEQQLVKAYNRYASIVHGFARAFGDPAWVDIGAGAQSVAFISAIQAATDNTSDNGARITMAERNSILAVGLPEPLTEAKLDEFVARNNRTLDYAQQGITRTDQVPAGQSTDFFATDVIDPVRVAAAQAAAADIEDGFETINESFNLARQNLFDTRLASDSGVCARVKIELNQQAVLTRAAFEATLTLTNNDQVGSLTGIGASIRVIDEAGADQTARFLIQPPTLSGLGAIDGSGVIGPRGEGSSRWIIVPRHEAAPDGARTYFITGSFRYVPPAGGDVVTVPLFPTPISVLPNPSLTLKYFLERVVYSNDPFTPALEPAVPFNLGLLVTNTGGGAARNLRLATGQPRIVENERGLLIDFAIIGTQLNNQGQSPSLSLNFGDVGPGQTQVAQFIMTSTLQGEFTDYSASFTNRNGLGDPSVSLIDSVRIFSLNHVVRSPRMGDDTLNDFLTDDTADSRNLPDHVHLSSGLVEPVTAFTSPSITTDPTGLTAEIVVSGFPADGFGYVQFDNPFAALGAKAISAVRSDGRVVTPGLNLWTTSRTVRREGQAPRAENLVRLFDFGGPGRYTIRFELPTQGPVSTAWRLAADHGPAGLQLLPVYRDGSSVEPRSGSVRELRVLFGAPIDPATFASSALNLIGLRGPDSLPVDLSGVTVTTEVIGNNTIGVVRLSSALPDLARYCLTMSGVRNFLGEPANENGTVSFAVVRGDASNDRRVNNSDVGAVLSVLGQTVGGGDVTNVLARADLDRDGTITQADVDIALSRRRTDARFIADPCPTNSPITAGDANLIAALPASAWTPGDDRAPRATSDWYTRRLTSDERAYLLGDGARRAYVAAGQVVPLRLDGSRIALRRATGLVEGAEADVLGASEASLDDRDRVASDRLPIGQAEQLFAASQPLAGTTWRVLEITGDRDTAIKALRQGGFATSPVFIDDLGGWMIPDDRVFAAAMPGVEATMVARLAREAGLELTPEASTTPGTIQFRLISPTLDMSDVLAAANRLAAQTQVLWSEPAWIYRGTRGVEARLAQAVADRNTRVLKPRRGESAATVAIIDDGATSEHPSLGAVVCLDAGGELQRQAKAGTYGTLAAGVIAQAPLAKSPSVLSIASGVSFDGHFVASSAHVAKGMQLAADRNSDVILVNLPITSPSDLLAWAAIEARNRGSSVLVPAGDSGKASALGLTPAVMAIAPASARGGATRFATMHQRVTVMALGEEIVTSDQPLNAGLIEGSMVRTGGSLLAAANAGAAALSIEQSGAARDVNRAASRERGLRLAGSPDGWTASSGYGFVSIDSLSQRQRQPFDLTGDGVTDGQDLAALTAMVAAGAYSERFDLNADDRLDELDVRAWISGTAR